MVALAGQPSRVTVATNMAGRGTDIRLGQGVAERGGLHVILTEYHELRRVDRQLFGRCARQGDPGSCEAIVSLEDEILLVYAPAATRLLERLGRMAPNFRMPYMAGFAGSPNFAPSDAMPMCGCRTCISIGGSIECWPFPGGVNEAIGINPNPRCRLPTRLRHSQGIRRGAGKSWFAPLAEWVWPVYLPPAIALLSSLLAWRLCRRRAPRIRKPAASSIA